MIATLEEVVKVLNPQGVRFIVIGGWAAIIHGTAHSTNDVDVVYACDTDNIRRLVVAIATWNPYLRGAPRGLPFRGSWRFGLLGEVLGGGTYEQLLPYTQETTSFGVTCRVVTLERLIQLKRAAGRPKDFERIAELQALLEEQSKRESSS